MSFLQRSKTAPEAIHPGPVQVTRSVSHEQMLPFKKKQPLNETASGSRVWAQRRPQKKGGYMQGWGPTDEEWDWLKEREARQSVSEEEVEETIRKEDKMGILFLCASTIIHHHHLLIFSQRNCSHGATKKRSCRLTTTPLTHKTMNHSTSP
ncbi:uncharacterized protein BT62DRAFT_927910 [Guyanagaster necrorhizus]|uniref:Uncharacterized protein n=1 Tax=Guyanagaster necrorhizus TaxID=856835 RepID=A0A9P7VZU2_9AGAR|nr:uncharacterized protein BT62DRAFT_927910 [Guyanagaster necrorhizus MCA 3950]KAG7450631.1 hypothetical protein BT62DRAFT_927910 [Guyanagaster necrorhizus MCA 3950]